jgi:small-conductance mechanosensitive channel
MVSLPDVITNKINEMLGNASVQKALVFFEKHDVATALFITVIAVLCGLIVKRLSHYKVTVSAKSFISYQTPLSLGRIVLSPYSSAIRSTNTFLQVLIRFVLSAIQLAAIWLVFKALYSFYPVINDVLSIRVVTLILVNVFIWAHYLSLHRWMRRNKTRILNSIHAAQFKLLRWTFLKLIAKHVLSFTVSLVQVLVIIPIISVYLSFLESNVGVFSNFSMVTRAQGVYIFVALSVFWTNFGAMYVDILKGIRRVSKALSRDIRFKLITLLRQDQLTYFFQSALRGGSELGLIYLSYSVISYATSLIMLGKFESQVQVIFQFLLNILVLVYIWKAWSWFNVTTAQLPQRAHLFSRILKRLLGINFKSPFNSFSFEPFLLGFIKVLRLFVTLFMTYVGFALCLRLLPNTHAYSAVVMGYVMAPMGRIWEGFIGFIPNVIVIVVIIIITNYVMNFARFFFEQVEKENLTFTGFHKDFAIPTYKIVRFLIFVFAVVLIFPYLPGANSPAFKGVSVFLGVLFSLGSSTFVTNIIAGLMLTYMRPFKIGDRVKIADTIGDIVEKNLLVTRIRTQKNIYVAIPNAQVLGAHITNFSFITKEVPVILHTTITIGYDVPWQKVHDLLIEAALKTGQILKNPKPFVHQTSLSDFYVEYEINAYTSNVSGMAAIYSDLHSNIQSVFLEAGVEITSPHYRINRDGGNA